LSSGGFGSCGIARTQIFFELSGHWKSREKHEPSWRESALAWKTAVPYPARRDDADRLRPSCLPHGLREATEHFVERSLHAGSQGSDRPRCEHEVGRTALRNVRPHSYPCSPLEQHRSR
jgi:hypothetical protein